MHHTTRSRDHVLVVRCEPANAPRMVRTTLTTCEGVRLRSADAAVTSSLERAVLETVMTLLEEARRHGVQRISIEVDPPRLVPMLKVHAELPELGPAESGLRSWVASQMRGFDEVKVRPVVRRFDMARPLTNPRGRLIHRR